MSNNRAISRLEYSVGSNKMGENSEETGGKSLSSPPNKIRRTDKGLPSTGAAEMFYVDGKAMELAYVDLKTFQTGNQTSTEPQVQNYEQTQVEKTEQLQMAQPTVQSTEPTQMTQPEVEVVGTNRVPEPPCNPGEGILQYCIVMKHPSTGKDWTVPLPKKFQTSIKKGLGEFETLDATNDKDEGIDTSEQLQTGANFGCGSPVSSCSSQNSLSSGDFLDKNIRGIAKSSEKIDNLSCDLNMVLPKNSQKLLETWFKDPLAMKRLTRYVLSDMKSHLMSLGANSAESAQLMQTLKSEDHDTLLLRLGKNLLEGRIIPKKAETKTMQENQETENSDFLTDAQEFEVASNSESNKNEPDEKSLKFMDEVNKYSETEPIPTGSSRDFPEVQNSSTSQKVRKVTVSLEVLENAYDHIFREVEKAKKVEKAGQVLFDAVFNDNDILECTVRGKKNTRTFDLEKWRFIDMMIAWLLTSPTKRTFKEFEKSEHQYVRLGPQDAEVLKKTVFTEHAYRKRRDLKKENANAQ